MTKERKVFSSGVKIVNSGGKVTITTDYEGSNPSTTSYKGSSTRLINGELFIDGVKREYPQEKHMQQKTNESRSISNSSNTSIKTNHSNKFLVKACINVGNQNALFISGAHLVLGTWKKAIRMTCIDAGIWIAEFEDDIIGSEFKFLIGSYNLGMNPSIFDLTWERGANRKLSPTVYYPNNFEQPPLPKKLEIELKNKDVMIPKIEIGEKRQSNVEIPESFFCSITLEVMREPVICTLDGVTYEEQAIKEWLRSNRTSPNTRAPMGPDQSINSVLVKNRNLKNTIIEFQANNPQLFDSSENKMQVRV